MTGSHSPHRAAQTTSRNMILVAAGSIGVGLLVMAIKFIAYYVTGSVALYSDALESIVNVLAGAAALVAIIISLKPADRSHNFGHHKAELFSASLEGALIIVAALLILREAYAAFTDPRALTAPLLGMAINGVATAINAGWALFLIDRGKAWRSQALEADGHHLMTDVVTSLGVLGGIAVATLTGVAILDPLIAVAVALHILWSGYRIVGRAVRGLMDEAAPPEVQDEIRALIRQHGSGALQAHDIRTRDAGRATFIEFHLVVPGELTVREAHVICDRIEAAVEAAIPGSEVVIHVEPDEKAKSPEARGVVEL